LSRARGRPGARWGPLGSALLVLTVADPTSLGEPGLQLSFAGAAGLTAWSGALSATVQRLSRGRCPKALAMGLAAGLAATMATLPFVAWHFERVSLVGIPTTLLATPLVTLALVGALASLALDFVSHTLASVLAGGTGVVVAALEVVAASAASLPWASVWTTRPTVVAAMAGITGATMLARHPRVGARARRGMVALYALTGAVGWPVLLSLQGRGSAEVLMIDVGQGDAIALRSPGGRWVLVDTGPAADVGGEAGHPVVRALRSRGVTRLDALILTHPDLDHVGGAAAVLRSLDVGVVYDPGLAAGKQAFLEALDAAAGRDVPWLAARAGGLIQLDELQLRVLHPPDGILSGGESNASSVVLLASFGAFDVLLTGDAYKEVDRLLAPDLPAPLEVLKVGHHGSDTSTDPLLLDAVRPEVALVSVGRYNRYGHPAPEVLERLRSSGSRIRRTDVDGSISVLGRADGTYYVSAGR
jgi:competence protein ComEC